MAIKDYKHVYLLHKSLGQSNAELKTDGNYDDQVKSQKSYELFCQMLTLFAAANFNLTARPSDVIFEKGSLKALLKYKDWQLTITKVHDEILDLDTIKLSMTKKDKTANYLFIPVSYHIPRHKKKLYEHIVARFNGAGKQYDKYVFLEPFNADDTHNYSARINGLHYAVLPVGIADIHSFKRIQKMLFECMTLTCPDVCGFCGNKFIKNENNKFCKKCLTTVAVIDCGDCSKNYTAIFVDAKTQNRAHEASYIKNLPQILKDEKRYSFRNIVNMKENKFICPNCNE